MTAEVFSSAFVPKNEKHICMYTYIYVCIHIYIHMCIHTCIFKVATHHSHNDKTTTIARVIQVLFFPSFCQNERPS